MLQSAATQQWFAIMDKRFFEIQRLGSEFGYKYSLAMEKIDCSWADCNYVLHQIDAFWLAADRKGVPVALACDQWLDFDVLGLDFGSIIRTVGDILASSARGSQLTHADVNSFIAQARMSNSKYQLRQEREESDEEE
ncbi:hypothetical protein [Pseudomonas viridiflava]|uniref:hypothetical protein n=1 Tax=Pseudomonas viridiflava TaxID=33069 RepID=UPI000F016073|nr:hypothetical protein [Pseudomonas viridiflava]